MTKKIKLLSTEELFEDYIKNTLYHKGLKYLTAEIANEVLQLDKQTTNYDKQN